MRAATRRLWPCWAPWAFTKSASTALVFALPQRAARWAITSMCSSSPSSTYGRMGAGSVHHIAFRAFDDASQREWREVLVASSLDVTPVLDRTYFHSIYFREPGGVLFELATDPPGFALDEPLASLGETLKLPPWLEPQRSRVERMLPPIALHTRK